MTLLRRYFHWIARIEESIQHIKSNRRAVLCRVSRSIGVYATKVFPLVKRTQIIVAEKLVSLGIFENRRARRMTLRIVPGETGFRVTTPIGLPIQEVERFLGQHLGWLEEKLKKLPENTLVRPGIKIPLRGVPHRIIHEPGKQSTVTTAIIRGEHACIVPGDIKHLPHRLANFLKREAKHDIEMLVKRHTTALGLYPKTIRYRDTKSRWGSCTADGALSFSWRIVMAPHPVINYLVSHEVTHLKEMNHSTRFWKLCENLCPDAPRYRDWLKRNGFALLVFQFDTRVL